MCECGCVMNWDRYTFPAPNKALYLLSISPHCDNCDAPVGVSIELIEQTNTLYKEYKKGDFSDGPLKFEQWPDTKGAAIVCGLRKHEFVQAVLPHLVGIDSRKMGENGAIDKFGAEVIAEEMYNDVQCRPKLLQ